ncbi:DNA translocase SpoIIIE [Peptococcaceae bacterium CEB3]|nr:DNA translocase SpoIIIE [Peptococcaceae bacterium CEB3]
MDYLYFAFALAWMIALVPSFRWLLALPGMPIITFGLCATSLLTLVFSLKIPAFKGKAPSIPAAEPEPEPSDTSLPPANKIFKPNKKRENTRGDARGPQLADVLARLISPGFTLINTAEGPSITQFRLKIPQEILSTPKKIYNNREAIKMNMAVNSCSIRLEPEKQAVIIELPRPPKDRYPVLVSDVLGYRAEHPLDVALGKTATGANYIIDLAKTPHLLIAGQTGGGKSVLINTILACLLTKRKPDELHLYLVDPKQVELKIYEGLPHLKAPIARTPEDAVALLTFVDREMRRRYEVLGAAGARDLQEYRRKGHLEIPYVVMVFDEVGDFMVTNKADIEGLITGLGQMARAAGIYLILATQRPSVDVISGVIKANIPSRIALRTASGVDSKVILDEEGAENLLGNGDMLVKMNGENSLKRVQGAFISTDETEKLVKWWKGVSHVE